MYILYGNINNYRPFDVEAKYIETPRCGYAWVREQINPKWDASCSCWMIPGTVSND